MAASAASQFQESLHSISPTDDARQNEELSSSKLRRSHLGEKSDLADGSSLSSSSLETQAFDPDSKEIRRVRWKVDRRLIPLLSVLYLCSFMDRVNIGNAKVANLEADLELQPGVYHLACSIFYIGYIMGEIPANLALKKIGPRTWIPIVMVAWGTISMSMAALTNGSGLLATRFFLGLAESGYAPGPVFIISLWYRRCEHALRVGIFFSAATIAGAFGGLLAYAIALLHGAGGLRAWQWIFIIEGVPTIICSIIAFIFLPNFPETSTFLTPAEKELNIKRLRIDAGPATDSTFSRSQVWAAFKDWKVIAHLWIGMLHSVTFASLGLFVPSITLGFGFDPVTTQLMTAPIYLAACVFTIVCALSSDYFSERGYHAAIPTAMGALGYFLLVITRDSPLAVRYISLIICTCGVYAFIPVQLSWPSSNIGGHTKKAVAIALIISLAQIGSIVGGQLYRDYDAPFYIRSHTICACLLLVNFFNILGLKYLLRRENRRRDQLTPEDYEQECRESDATDKHPDFRYFE
ncbi:hypothetical protein KVV02_004675 [Mortierella alpina]|uniref:Major facilitator superfamily (MFS) profile domain-containing protein n=1 Tax=Mortierella alpina TaxID=64518 RepID=A0A9P8CYS3_MORAP|nr:hypothetical protein KVV02_004675 [Mortierella alpina]